MPVKAFSPIPATGGTDVALDATLNWRPGREAVQHQVSVGTDANAVANGTAPVKTVTDHKLALGSLGLEYGRTYYWKVSEVNEAAATQVWDGDVWSFTAIGYGVIDDMDAYDDVCNRIFFAWVDGFPRVRDQYDRHGILSCNSLDVGDEPAVCNPGLSGLGHCGDRIYSDGTSPSFCLVFNPSDYLRESHLGSR